MKNRKTIATLGFALLATLMAQPALSDNGPVPVPGTSFVINVVDFDPANGFGDPSPADPASTAGGNPGLTIGEQRLEAYKEAARIWNSELGVDQQVVVQAIFVGLACDANSGVLGAAGTLTVFRDFGGDIFPSTWYSAALANEISGFDLGGTEPDPGFQAPPFNDEIFSLFNSDLGKPDCLENSGWYYGFDGNNPAGTIDFLAVLVHELGHGLGFQNFANDFTGENFLGFPDQWSRFQYDNLIGRSWGQMVDAERGFSTTNGPNLLWSGPNVFAEAPNVLGPAQVIRVNAPAPAELPFGTANFGPPVPAGGLTGDVVLVDDGTGPASDGCEAIANDVSGKIALIDRGGCTFVAKALNAQDAGATGVIIANNQPGNSPIGLGGSSDDVTILTVSVTQAGGQLLRAAGTNVTIGVDASDGTLAGADANGLVKLYAPFPVQPGSSVAHFDVSAFPNLLMEPFISGDLNPSDPTIGTDLTDELLNDIGWDGNGRTCPVTSSMGPEIVLLGALPTGVSNRAGAFTVFSKKGPFAANFRGATASGCTLQDVINACTPAFLTGGLGGQYQSCIAHVTGNLVKQGNLTAQEAEAIRETAAIAVPFLNSL